MWLAAVVAIQLGLHAAGETEVDECNLNFVCVSSSQRCVDPSPLLGDWMCVCTSPLLGQAVASVASCELPSATSPPSPPDDDSNETLQIVALVVPLVVLALVLLACAVCWHRKRSMLYEEDRLSKISSLNSPRERQSPTSATPYKELQNPPPASSPPPQPDVAPPRTPPTDDESDLLKPDPRSAELYIPSGDVPSGGGLVCSRCGADRIMPWAVKCPRCASSLDFSALAKSRRVNDEVAQRLLDDERTAHRMATMSPPDTVLSPT
eukprot:Sspe_Gene.69352::Locus_40881_Transcript_1_1_Confidence_1.000_Length_2164::g.69352::m.69352